MRKCNLGTKSCIIITLNLIPSINKHSKWKYKKITLIRYGLVYVFRHRNYKPEICFNFVDVILDSHRVINKKSQKQLLAIVRSRKYLKSESIHVVLFEGAIDDCRYSRRSLQCVISNFLACPLNFSSNSRLKNIRYLELRYLELSLSRTNYLVP